MKKTFLVPLFLAALALTGCNPSNQGPLAPGSEPAANLYAFQAATSIGLASKLTSNQTNVMKAREVSEEEIVKTITDYLPTMDAALSGMDELTSAKEEASDREGYASKMTISFKDEALKDNSFTMYFNETGLNEEVPSLPEVTTETVETTEIVTSTDTTTTETVNPPKNAREEDEDDDDESEDEEDSEQETQINGIIVTNDGEYVMHGEKELDPVDNEYEVSFEYHIDETTLVKVEQEIENGEQEFEYSIEKDGETIYEYSIEVEDKEVGLEVKKAGEVESEFSFEIVEKDGKSLIKATYEAGKKEVEYLFEKVISEDGSTVIYTLVK